MNAYGSQPIYFYLIVDYFIKNIILLLMINQKPKGGKMAQIIKKSRLSAKQSRLICNAYSVKISKSQFDKSWNLLKKDVDALRQELNAQEIYADTGDGLGQRGFIFIPKERSYFDIKKFSEENPKLYKKYLDKSEYIEYKPIAN